mmetsp:Transcript_11275/g.14753  ORF Transcript_11275/g.14753 Transcript_11275/m.14753 type:complete len:429 (+) Transcript_11275:89-1375(+)
MDEINDADYLPSPFRYEEKSKFPIAILQEETLNPNLLGVVKSAIEDYWFDSDPECMDFESNKDYSKEEKNLYGVENEWAFQVRFFMDHPAIVAMIRKLSELLCACKNENSEGQKVQDVKFKNESREKHQEDQDDTFIKVDSKKSRRAKKKKARKELKEESTTMFPQQWMMKDGNEGKDKNVQLSGDTQRTIPLSSSSSSKPVVSDSDLNATAFEPSKQNIQMSEDGKRVISISSKPRTSVPDFKKSILELQQRISLLEAHNMEPEPHFDANRFDWRSERQDRRDRQHNLILYKIKGKRLSSACIVHMLNEIYSGLNKIFRKKLSVWDLRVKYLSDSTVLVTFQDKMIRDAIWRNRYLLGKLKDIFVKTDFTLHQRKRIQRIRGEVAELNKQAPKHQRIFIKVVGCSLFVNNFRMTNWEQSVKEFLEHQ